MTINTNPTVKEVNSALLEGKTVVYKDEQEIVFLLSPFGGGTSRTGEFKLKDTFKVTDENVLRMVIIEL